MEEQEFAAAPKLKKIEHEKKELALKEFIAEIQRLKDKTGMSQRKLGALIGMEQPSMVRFFAGNYGITLELVQKLAEAFHDNPHRLADIFWGIAPSAYSDPNKVLLDQMWDLMAKHYHALPLSQDLPPHTTIPVTPEMKEELTGAIQKADEQIAARKNGETPETISQNPTAQDNTEH